MNALFGTNENISRGDPNTEVVELFNGLWHFSINFKGEGFEDDL